MIHHPTDPLRPMPWHAEACDCTACNPPVPSIAEPSLLTTVVELAGYVAFGFLVVWIVDRLIDGPGVQIMWGA